MYISVMLRSTVNSLSLLLVRFTLGDLVLFLNDVRIVVLYWDFLVTFSLEVERFWGPRFSYSWATLSYFACRYLSLISHVPVVVQVIVPSGNEAVCAS